VPRSDSVSAVIPTYNRNELLLTRALPSVLAQTHPIDEVHIVADGMIQPEFGELQDALDALGDKRIILWRIPRQQYPDDPGQRWCVLGLNARNHGLDQARGDWVAPLDDDDAWTSDHIEVLLRECTKWNVDFTYGRSEYHWPDGRTQWAGSWPPGMGAFCDGAQLYRNGMGYRYDPRCIERGLPEDGDLWGRMVKGGVRFNFIPELVHHYYPNPR
jgi:glycosyltransferase involved in cell wall biosynthesis